jgi:hypothetical protein
VGRQLALVALLLLQSRLGHRIGQLSDADLLRLNRSLLVFLGLAR